VRACCLPQGWMRWESSYPMPAIDKNFEWTQKWRSKFLALSCEIVLFYLVFLHPDMLWADARQYPRWSFHRYPFF
jgi:hypothetical protein